MSWLGAVRRGSGGGRGLVLLCLAAMCFVVFLCLAAVCLCSSTDSRHRKAFPEVCPGINRTLSVPPCRMISPIQVDTRSETKSRHLCSLRFKSTPGRISAKSKPGHILSRLKSSPGLL